MSFAQTQIGFFASLGVSVLLLVAVLATAKLHKVKAHLACVALMVVALLVTIFFAEALGAHYVFEANSRQIHLPLAFLATGLLVAPLATGFLHWKGRVGVKPHKVAVGVWVLSVFAALGTGGYMLSQATRIEGASGGPQPTPSAAPAPSATPS